ncbi:MAG: hypothetical protein MZV70_45340 [Desulfobacterales bacterium]|nr:hypothetical protein [Desulfobacterales bacterium]
MPRKLVFSSTVVKLDAPRAGSARRRTAHRVSARAITTGARRNPVPAISGAVTGMRPVTRVRIAARDLEPEEPRQAVAAEGVEADRRLPGPSAGRAQAIVLP